MQVGTTSGLYLSHYWQNYKGAMNCVPTLMARPQGRGRGRDNGGVGRGSMFMYCA
jgi:hypothetical protein